MGAVTVSASAPLNPKPLQSEDREKQHLPPKTYPAVVEELSPAVSGVPLAGDKGNTNGTNHGNDTEEKDSTSSSGNRCNPESTNHTASVLKIVNTGSTDTTAVKTGTDEKDEMLLLGRQESQHECEAPGPEDTLRSPPRYKHRKTPLKNSIESQNGITENSKEDGSLSQKSIVRKDVTTAEKILGTESPVYNSKAKKVNDEKNGDFEKLEVERNGSKLVSVKPTMNYEKSLLIDRKEAPRTGKDGGLVSGKKAGQRWENSAIRFAPLNVPLHRRLQTLVVLFHTLCIALSVSAFFFLCAIPIFWPLLIPYMIYCMSSKASTSGTLHHRSDLLRSLPVWSLFASYFPARLHRTVELIPTRKYIFGYHPHGIISHGAFAAFATEALGFSQLFPGIKNTLLTLDSNFRIPIYRDYALAMGLASVSKESCENLLSKGGPNKEGMGRAITIVVGGARESLDAHPYSLRLVLKRRKGFVKMAIRTGADLVPVLAFGENDLYDQFLPGEHPNIHKVQLLVKKLLGFTIPLFHARGVFNYDVGLMPYRRPVNIVCGRPVKIIQNPKPEQEEVDRVHEEYVNELERLWDLWKDEFSPNRQGELEILE